MKPDTPLTEVAAHLPQDAAAHLLNYGVDVQNAVLSQVRSVVIFWETQGYTFDPLEYGAILSGFVPSIAVLYSEVFALRQQNANLQSRLAGTDLLVNSLSANLLEQLTKKERQS